MTSTHRRQLDRIHEQMATDLRFQLDQARRESAALAGDLGVHAQLIAMSAVYHELKAAGQLDDARAIRLAAIAIIEGGT